MCEMNLKAEVCLRLNPLRGFFFFLGIVAERITCKENGYHTQEESWSLYRIKNKIP